MANSGSMFSARVREAWRFLKPERRTEERAVTEPYGKERVINLGNSPEPWRPLLQPPMEPPRTAFLGSPLALLP